MAELRDSIKANWTTTGQELSKDFRQFWQSSRPASPARTPTREQSQSDAMEAHNVARSPSAISRLSHLDIPRANNNTRESSEFAAGYNLGLIGGVRSWVCLVAKVKARIYTNPSFRWPAAAATLTTAGPKALSMTAQTSRKRGVRKKRPVAVLANKQRAKQWTLRHRKL
jgi:hypothetical protein